MTLLSPYRPEQRERVLALSLHEAQQPYVAPMAQTLAELHPGLSAHLIGHGEQIAGFFLIDQDYAQHYPFASADSVGLRSFFVDQRFQGMGLAKRSLQALPAYLQAQGMAATAVFLTVNCKNAAAIPLYRQCGFADTGELYLGGGYGPQHIMRLAL
ncbi:GNAT family N-acetyltransferase [Comamonas sp. MYb21]|uniref:GNAT family N-acetyltransferase n=1 Tax=unclassified Comamonas TaxID=2638500 RepID=UPI0030B796DF